MKYWPNHVFAFLLSITEVNINFAATYFSGQQQMGQIKFQKLLAKTLIFNTHYNEEKDKTPDNKCKQGEYGHCLIMLPKSKNFLGTQIIPANSQYPQHKCTSCIKRVHSYCLCSPGIYQCAECFGYHLVCTENNLSTLSKDEKMGFQ